MRFRTRFMKVYRDLTANFSKSLMMASAIAIGVLSVGSILGAYAVLTREMARNYLGTSPADATLEIKGRGIDQQLVEKVKRVNGVGDAERHATILGRMKIGGDWYPMLFFVVDRFDNMATNRFTRISGAWPPPTGTMLVERTARRVMQSEEKGRVLVKTSHGQLRPLSISGVVHDPGLAPAWQEQEGYGYISLETLHELGESQGFDELRIRLANHNSSPQEIEKVSRRVAELARSEGYEVEEVQIPPPRRHPHQSQMNAILLLFLVFSLLTLVLSAILVSTSLATVMTRQVREIGVMKTIGASSAQIAGLYFLTQVLLALVAVAVSIPLSRHTAALLIARISTILNLEIFDSSIPGWVFGVEAMAGLLIPLAAAAIPVWRGSRVSVREALDSYGVSTTRFGEGFLDRLISRLSFFFSRGFALALRNIFRQRWRLVMSLGLLAAGGALFMTALNVSKAWDANLQKIYKYRHYDLEMRLSEPSESRDVIPAIRKVRGVSAVEAWQRYPTAFAQDVPYDIVRVYPDKGHGSFVVLGVPGKTKFVDFPMLSGRWLSDAGGNEVVLNHTVRFQAPNLRVGDTVNLSIQGRPTQWKLVGFVEDMGSTGATAYVPAEALANLAGVSTETANMIRVALDDRGSDAVLRKTRDVEDVLGARAHVSMALPMTLIRNAIAEHMSVLVSALLALSVLMATVGAFGLASTMSMNIMERTRELGVMRAIGATPAVIARIVVIEGFAISAFSVVLAVAFSVGLSSFMGRLIGNMAFRTPLPLAFSSLGFGLWLLILIVGSAAATAIPARSAGNMTVREALAYL
jgi:putative ABC transport system permease protein